MRDHEPRETVECEPGKETFDRESLAPDQKEFLDTYFDPVVQAVYENFNRLFSDPEPDIEAFRALQRDAFSSAEALEIAIRVAQGPWGIPEEALSGIPRIMAECAARFRFCYEIGHASSYSPELIAGITDREDFKNEVIEALGDIAPRLADNADLRDLAHGFESEGYATVRAKAEGDMTDSATWYSEMRKRLDTAGIETARPLFEKARRILEPTEPETI